MDLSPKDLRTAPKVVGKCDGDKLYEMTTKGGLRAIARVKKAASGAPSYEFMGIGSHRALARHVAKAKNKNCEFVDDLAKSEYLDRSIFERHLQQAQWLTDRILDRLG